MENFSYAHGSDHLGGTTNVDGSYTPIGYNLDAEGDCVDFPVSSSHGAGEEADATRESSTASFANDFFASYFTPQLFNSFTSQFSPSFALPSSSSSTSYDFSGSNSIGNSRADPVNLSAGSSTSSLDGTAHSQPGGAPTTTTMDQFQFPWFDNISDGDTQLYQQIPIQRPWYIQPSPKPIVPSRPSSTDEEGQHFYHHHHQQLSSIASGSSGSLPFLDYSTTSPSTFPNPSNDGSLNGHSMSGLPDLPLRYSVGDHQQQRQLQLQQQQMQQMQTHQPYQKQMPLPLRIDTNTASSAAFFPNAYHSPNTYDGSHCGPGSAVDSGSRRFTTQNSIISSSSSSPEKRKRQDTGYSSAGAAYPEYEYGEAGSPSSSSTAMSAQGRSNKRLSLARPEPDMCAPPLPDAPYLAFMKSVRRRMPEGTSYGDVAVEAGSRWSTLASNVREHLEEGYNLACQAHAEAMRAYVQSPECSKYLEYLGQFCRINVQVYVNPYRDYMGPQRHDSTPGPSAQYPQVQTYSTTPNSTNHYHYPTTSDGGPVSASLSRNGSGSRRVSLELAGPHTGSSIGNDTSPESGEHNQEEDLDPSANTSITSIFAPGCAEAGFTNHPRRKKPKADANAPVKPFSAYVKYGRERRAQFATSDKTFSEVSKIIGTEWRAINAPEKERMMQSAQKAKEKYDAAIRQYRTTQDWRNHQQYLRNFETAKAGSAAAVTAAANPV